MTRLLSTVLLLFLSVPAFSKPEIWIHDDRSQVAVIDLSDNSVVRSFNTDRSYTDIAFSPTGQLYGVTFSALFTIDTETGASTFVGNHGVPGGNALEFDTDGVLYAAGGSSTLLYTLDPITGEATVVGDMGYRSAGDIAFNGARLFLANRDDELVELIIDDGVTGTLVGPFGVDNVFGLGRTDNGALYAGAGSSLYEVNPFTGSATLAADFSSGAGIGDILGAALEPQQDTDVDGLPDYWENRYGLNPYDPSDAQDDPDDDRLGNLTEYQLGTNPTVADTDGDQVSDSEEVDQGSDPLDATNVISVPSLRRRADTNLLWLRIDSDGDVWLDDAGTSACTSFRDKPTVILTHGVSPRSALAADTSDPSALRLWTEFATDEVSTDADGIDPDLTRGAANILARSSQEPPQTSILDAPLTAPPFNVVLFRWDGAFTVSSVISRVDYYRAYTHYYDAGVQLALKLKECLGEDYENSVHFIGHSMGTAVNSVATKYFLTAMPQVQTVQFTALDRPDRIEKISNIGLGLEVARNTAERRFLWSDTLDSDRFERFYNFDSSFFAAWLDGVRPPCGAGQTSNCLRVDNYYADSTQGRTSAGVGAPSEGEAVYNYFLEGRAVENGLVSPNDVGDEFFAEGVFGFIDNDHSGVQQWYRWSISPNDSLLIGDRVPVCDFDASRVNLPDGFDASLSPCGVGWDWSLNGPNSAGWPGPNQDGEVVIFGLGPIAIDLSSAQGFGFEFISNGTGPDTIRLSEQSSPFLVVDIDVPEDADYASFYFTFPDVGDGDHVAVYINNEPIWVVNAESFEAGTRYWTGNLPVVVEQGTNRLSVAVFGANEPNIILDLDDLSFSKVQANQDTGGGGDMPPPAPPAPPTPPSDLGGGGSVSLFDLFFVMFAAIIFVSRRIWAIPARSPKTARAITQVVQ